AVYSAASMGPIARNAWASGLTDVGTGTTRAGTSRAGRSSRAVIRVLLREVMLVRRRRRAAMDCPLLARSPNDRQVESMTVTALERTSTNRVSAIRSERPIVRSELEVLRVAARPHALPAAHER